MKQKREAYSMKKKMFFENKNEREKVGCYEKQLSASEAKGKEKVFMKSVDDVRANMCNFSLKTIIIQCCVWKSLRALQHVLL